MMADEDFDCDLDLGLDLGLEVFDSAVVLRLTKALDGFC